MLFFHKQALAKKVKLMLQLEVIKRVSKNSVFNAIAKDEIATTLEKRKDLTDYFKVSRQDLESILGDKMVLYKNFGDRLIFAISKVIDIDYQKTDKMFLMIDSLIKTKTGKSQLNGKMATFLDKDSPNRTYFVTFTSSENDNTLNFFVSLFATKTILDSGEKIFRKADTKFSTAYLDDWERHTALISYINPSIKG